MNGGLFKRLKGEAAVLTWRDSRRLVLSVGLQELAELGGHLVLPDGLKLLEARREGVFQRPERLRLELVVDRGDEEFTVD